MGGSQSRLAPSHLEARRARAIAMVTQGETQAEVARQLGVTREAVRQWVHAYRTGGPAGLAPRPRRERGRVPLAELAQTIDRASRADEALTTGRAREVLERAHGVAYSLSSVRAILRRLAYVHTRAGGWRRVEPVVAEDAPRRAG
ncbi:MAG TPA: helix-turn-helix domain-containing protein [Polyangiaceae bacterium]